MIAETQNEAATKMQHAVDHAREDMATIRTGRAHHPAACRHASQLPSTV